MTVGLNTYTLGVGTVCLVTFIGMSYASIIPEWDKCLNAAAAVLFPGFIWSVRIIVKE